MMNIIEKIQQTQNITREELEQILTTDNEAIIEALRQSARSVANAIYGNKIYIRGLIEISNYCKNDCLYCGLRRSNPFAVRYRLTDEQIYACCEEGYQLGFRTFVMQGGEDGWFDDKRMCRIVSTVRNRYPDCAITLSLGERSHESYQALYDAGANRYLLRHETASPEHYAKLHPTEMSWQHRMECLCDLKEIGYQVGCGFMVGSPYQTFDTLYADLQFIRKFRPQMVGIGPFISAHDTPFAGQPNGKVSYTLRLLAIIRLLQPPVLLPATTALGTLHPQGRELGIQYGANVLMPNLSPTEHRKDYAIYDGKICTGEESAQCKVCTEQRIRKIGYEMVVDRGDYKAEEFKC
ncbi:MAG: [Bacteroidales bacterium]|nr:[FeFe] hydrogenase H-cluster radical SAM maturase HydE [Bacteroidales bacterium]